MCRSAGHLHVRFSLSLFPPHLRTNKTNSCYNNCPGDSRKTEAEGQVSIYCGNASLYGNKATQKAATPTGNSAADSTDAPEASPTQGSDKSSTGDAAASETSKGGAAELAMNAGGVLLAVAGVMAVIV